MLEITLFAGGVGGSPLTVDGEPIVVNGEGGQGLVAGAFPVVVGAPVATQQAGAGGVGGGTGAGAGDINTSLVTAVPEISEDTEDGVKTGNITGIGPYTSTEFIIVNGLLENGTTGPIKDFSQCPYKKDVIIGAVEAIDKKGASFDVFTDSKGCIESIIINSSGGGYSVGEIITLSGSDLGASSPEDNVTFEVTSIN